MFAWANINCWKSNCHCISWVSSYSFKRIWLLSFFFNCVCKISLKLMHFCRSDLHCYTIMNELSEFTSKPSSCGLIWHCKLPCSIRGTLAHMLLMWHFPYSSPALNTQWQAVISIHTHTGHAMVRALLSWTASGILLLSVLTLWFCAHCGYPHTFR